MATGVHFDRSGLHLSTDSAEAAAAYRRGIDRILAVQPGQVEPLTESVEADPDFALAHAALAKIDADDGLVEEARFRLARVDALVESGRVTDRERGHIRVISQLVQGRVPAALAAIEDHVARFPTDAFALAPASGVFGLIGFSGRAGRESEQLALLEPLAPHYGDDWWFLAMHGFALVEVGRGAEGRELVERSLALRPDNAGAVHVRAHALYEGGHDVVASGFLADWLPGYDRAGALHCHLGWHYCLLLLAAGRTEEMWSVYDRELAPETSPSPPINVFTDGASLLWRTTLTGESPGPERWQRLIGYQRERFPIPTTFVDAHATLPLAALGDTEALEVHLAAVEQAAGSGRLAAGDLALVIGRAALAYAEQRWADVIDTLGHHLDEIVRMGGSRAQRDLAANTVLAAHVRAGRVEEAEILMASLDDTYGRRPSRPLGPAPSTAIGGSN